MGQNTPRGNQFLTARFYLTARASTDGQTDGRTDGQGDSSIPPPPPNFVAGGIIRLLFLTESLIQSVRRNTETTP